MSLTERTVPGLHAYVAEVVMSLGDATGRSAIDLGGGSGALADRLATIGYEVTVADRDEAAYGAAYPFVRWDLDEDAPSGLGRWDLVCATEVIEHLENPIRFLRVVRSLLAPGGHAVVTTPNLDSLPARAKFALKGRLRLMDVHGDPTHITPIFWDLLTRQYLPRSGLALDRAEVYPPHGFVSGRRAYRPFATALARLGRDPRLLGDNHVLVLR